MARLNISISDELKADMDRVPDRINWSALAAEVFSREVRMVARVDRMNLDAIVNRLRASREEEKAMEREMGHTAGADWAAQRATYSLLKLIAGARRDDAILMLLTGKGLGGRLSKFEHLEFWDLLTGSPRVPRRPYVEGFLDGATQVWARVAAKVEEEL